MNYSKLFYWLTVADNAKTFFITCIVIFMIISVISTVLFFASLEESDKSNNRVCRKWMWWSYPFTILFWSLYIFTPSKKDALLIVAGGQTLNYLTTDSTARKIPHEMTNFVVTELKNMAQEAKVELNINNQKEKVLNEAKQMSSEELIEKLKSDSALRNIILK